MREGNKEGGAKRRSISQTSPGWGVGGGIRISFIDASKAEFRIPTVFIYLLAEHPSWWWSSQHPPTQAA